ncbi:MAG: hypothetical protein EOP61_39775 [Sphingomonadales bacterium]|nr:MAG: hypothetical protein EOP61_39775 [Sphingomonadales bacterium]
MLRALRILIPAVLVMFAVPAAAQDDEVPYWASIRATVVNMRVGPAESYKIDWVYKRVGLPLRVLRRKEGWRLVEDPDGARGWLLARFLSRDRGAYVIGNGQAELRKEPKANAQTLWLMEPGVTGKLERCEAGWCTLDVGGHRGFVRQDRLWGAGEP